MDAFTAAMSFTRQEEGGRVDDPSDPGGRTNDGVTQRTYDAWCRKHGLRPQSVYRIREVEIISIYREFWSGIGCDKLAPGVAIMAFDIGFNAGPGRIIPWLRQTDHLPAVARVKKLDALRCGFWRHLRIFNRFGLGWMRREHDCYKLALSMK